MAYNVKTIVKLFMIFLFFQLSLVSILTLVPIMNNNLTSDDSTYIAFLNGKTNFLGDNTGDSLLADLLAGMPSENIFNDSILNTFLGIYKIIASSIKFLVELAIGIIAVPNTITSILLFNFMGNTAFLTGLGVILNIGFYSFLWYATFKEGIK